MAKFNIDVYEGRVLTYEVEAESHEAAYELYKKGDLEPHSEGDNYVTKLKIFDGDGFEVFEWKE